MLKLQNISYQVQGNTILNQVSAAVKPGTFTALMGSNGAGKSTLLKIIAGETSPTSGRVTWDQKSIPEWNANELAKNRAVLRQQYSMQLPFSVQDIIAMGRYPHYKNTLTKACKQVIQTVAEYTGVTHLMKRNYLTLSGGEQQRVQLARVLAQVWDTPAEQKLILLDEPVSALDIQYQHHLMALTQALTQHNFTIVAVLHDLNLAMQYADDILLLKKGKVITFAHKNEALQHDTISETFGIAAALHQVEGYEHPIITVNHYHTPQHFNNL
jgi:iron complex transport system ATP-binding protein